MAWAESTYSSVYPHVGSTTDSSILHANIDNSKNIYYLEYWQDMHFKDPNPLAIIGVVIEYTITETY